MVCVDPKTDALWSKLLDRFESSVFHSPGWLRVLVNTYDLDIRAHVLLDGSGEPRAGIPFCRIVDMKGERTVILPFSDYCDPLVAGHDEWECLVGDLVDEGHPIALRCLHNDVPLQDERFERVNRAKWHGLDLRPDLDTLWRGLNGSARRAIKKAHRERVVVRLAESHQDLRAFFDMHLGVRKYKYRLVAQPFSFFQNIWREFVEPGHGFILLACHQGRIVGGIFALVWQDRLYYKFNASAPSDLAARPNDLMIWEAIQHGKARGLTHLDFGLSDWEQEGLVRYKRKFASQEKTVSFLRYVPRQPVTRAEQELRQLLPQLTDLFTDVSVPDDITEKAGAILYRLFT
jgi:CelD/BcsL family acetyltransferase involved in cellulose biosynthesis